jgi:hypothetical protein
MRTAPIPSHILHELPEEEFNSLQLIPPSTSDGFHCMTDSKPTPTFTMVSSQPLFPIPTVYCEGPHPKYFIISIHGILASHNLTHAQILSSFSQTFLTITKAC